MIPLNSLAVYKGRPALVTETGDKIAITAAAASGKTETLKVREKDIEVLHPGPLRSLAELALSGGGVPGSGSSDAGADVRGAWELIEAGKAPVSLRELAELAYGSFTPQSAWAAWLLLADGLYFTGTADALEARPMEEVKAAEEKRRGKLRETADREAFLDRLRALVKSRAEGGETVPGAADGRFFQDVEALAFGKTERSKTMKDLGRSETPQEAHRLLLECGYWSLAVNPHPQRFGLVPGALAPAAPPAPTEEFRRDLTALPAYAIDSPWSADPDDAVFLEHSSGGRRILYVHVADPASAISSDSPADREARGRGATLYLPELTSRMLAEEDLPRFALGLSEVSPALTFKLTLGSAPLCIEDIEIFPSLTRVTRLTYEEADRLALEGNKVLGELFALGEENLARRLRAGAVSIEFPEVHINAGPGPSKEWVVTITPIVHHRSSEMVRECMLLAGEGAASWASRRQIPFPCIIQETGDLPAHPLPALAGSYQLRRCMRPRSVSSRPGFHWALGLDGYSQVTSPLRRYTDLLAHQQIRAVLKREQEGEGEILGGDELLMRLAAGDAAAQAVTQAERASKAHWTAVYLQTLLLRAKKGGEAPVWDAVALEKKGAGLAVLIPALGLETVIAGKKSAEPNEKIQVKLGAVRIPEGEVLFTWAG